VDQWDAGLRRADRGRPEPGTHLQPAAVNVGQARRST